MKIIIETIPHKEQRYPTVGDWFYDEAGTITIRVSQLSDWRYEALVAVHELVEVLLCRQNQVSPESVDSFDTAFEKARLPGNVDEPGDSPLAPYNKEHCIATGLERVLAASLGVVWQPYDQEVSGL